MKSSAVLLALSALGAALDDDKPDVAKLMYLVARQEITTIITTTTSTSTPPGAVVTQEPVLSCISSYGEHLISVASEASLGIPTMPSAVQSFYDELTQTATTDYWCVLATASVPPDIVSQEMDYYSSLAEHGDVWTSPPPQCSDAWNQVLTAALEDLTSVASSCQRGATATGASATHTVTQTGNATSATVTPVPTAAAGRSGVSAGLAIGAAAVFGYLELA
ncbi:hypothetical protein PspLS_12011 [Pyricularia sp. CBS 133598]|nr:hypothetical protein PspLS_12011 [Pyricularia sp. CBS 133598]